MPSQTIMPLALGGERAPADCVATRGAAEPSSRSWLSAALPLIGVLAACLPFRLVLARGPAKLMFPLPEELLASPWLLLAPFDFGGGRYRWTPTGHVVMGLLNLWIPAPLIFVLLLTVLVIVVYVLSLRALNSRVFSTTLAMALAFGTQFNYSYVHNGGHIWILYTLYLLINLYFLHALAMQPSPRRGTRIGFVVSLVVFALCWEQWLDYLVFLLAASVFAYLRCRRDPELRARYFGRLRFIVVSTLVVTTAYLAVKLPYCGEHLTPGHESDTIFTYPTPVMAAEDFLSNVITYPYIALTNFTPSCFSSSNTLYHYGADAILREQHGYHPQKAELVVMHHVFLWYYYAGAVFVAFVWFCIRCARNAWKAPTEESLIVAILVVMICTGFATHSIIKYRPYMSVPLLSYKCLVSVIGFILLVAYGVDQASKRFASRRLYNVALVGVWLAMVIVGIERFPYHSHLSQEAGLGPYPSPIRSAKQWLREHRGS